MKFSNPLTISWFLISFWKTIICILGYATFVIGEAKDYAACAPQGIIQIMEEQFFSQKWEESTQCQDIDLMYGCLTSWCTWSRSQFKRYTINKAHASFRWFTRPLGFSIGYLLYSGHVLVLTSINK